MATKKINLSNVSEEMALAFLERMKKVGMTPEFLIKTGRLTRDSLPKSKVFDKFFEKAESEKPVHPIPKPHVIKPTPKPTPKPEVKPTPKPGEVRKKLKQDLDEVISLIKDMGEDKQKDQKIKKEIENDISEIIADSKKIMNVELKKPSLLKKLLWVALAIAVFLNIYQYNRFVRKTQRTKKYRTEITQSHIPKKEPVKKQSEEKQESKTKSKPLFTITIDESKTNKSTPEAVQKSKKTKKARSKPFVRETKPKKPIKKIKDTQPMTEEEATKELLGEDVYKSEKQTKDNDNFEQDVENFIKESRKNAKKLDSINAELTKLKKVSDKIKNIKPVEIKNDSLRQKAEQIKQGLKNLELDVNFIDGEISSLDRKIKQVDESIKNMESMFGDNIPYQDLASLKNLKKDLEEKKKKLEEKKKELEEMIKRKN